MVDRQYTLQFFQKNFVVSPAKYYSKKNPALVPILPSTQSPYHCVLDSLRTPSIDLLSPDVGLKDLLRTRA